MTLVRFIPVLILISVLVGCSGPKSSVTTDFDPEADFSTYQTWDWLPGEPPETGDRRLDDQQVRERIRGVIEEELTTHGFPQSREAPDFHVIYHAGLDQEINQRTVANYYQYIDYVVFVPWTTSSYNESWDIGTLIVDFFDTNTHTLVWRGIGRIKFNAQAGPRENEPIIRKGVREMIERFPPK
jgi:hypothetical protein